MLRRPRSGRLEARTTPFLRSFRIETVSNGWPRVSSSLKSPLKAGEGLLRTDELPRTAG
jgi:hypothetical protein